MKSSLLRTGIVLAALMFAATALAVVLRPSHKIASQGPKINLETMIPIRFGDWQLDPVQPITIINPVQEQNINRIYDQTLSRTYMGPNGERIMLSIAYGADQRSGLALQVHYPEVCYTAQGFEVVSSHTSSIPFDHGTLPVRLLEAKQGNRRFEPITYWMTIGTYVTLGGWDRRLIELRYGLRKEIPDGLLFRISSIDNNSANAFAIQEQFIKELLKHIPTNDRLRLAGHGTQ